MNYTCSSDNKNNKTENLFLKNWSKHHNWSLSYQKRRKWEFLLFFFYLKKTFYNFLESKCQFFLIQKWHNFIEKYPTHIRSFSIFLLKYIFPKFFRFQMQNFPNFLGKIFADFFIQILIFFTRSAILWFWERGKVLLLPGLNWSCFLEFFISCQAHHHFKRNMVKNCFPMF